ncbi:hypothetical protein HRbin19_01477 [bacterium HR19]|nr:hypothetical protein HRbin19_01477 [bacterium HR19]
MKFTVKIEEKDDKVLLCVKTLKIKIFQTEITDKKIEDSLKKLSETREEKKKEKTKIESKKKKNLENKILTLIISAIKKERINISELSLKIKNDMLCEEKILFPALFSQALLPAKISVSEKFSAEIKLKINLLKLLSDLIISFLKNNFKNKKS